MSWRKISSTEEVQGIIENSTKLPQVIFKHSTRCSISSLAYQRLEEGVSGIDCYLVDVISSRDVSNFIAQKFEIIHQSPQLLIIHDGKCKFDTSHLGISSKVLKKELSRIE